jgi:hypothetical protein
MSMEPRAAKNNADNNDPVLLLPSSFLPLSLCHHLPPAFLIVECPHHRFIVSSFCQLLLAFTTHLSMVGCCVHAHFVVLRPFRRPLLDFIISRHCASIDAFVAGHRTA